MAAIDALRLEGVTKRFGAVTALHEAWLKVEDGEFVTLLGPSGCGKTTLLNLIAGFLEADAGEIFPATAKGPWKDTSVQKMGQDVHAAYQQVIKEEPRYAGIVPVGLAFSRAIDTGIADGNPYDDLGASKINLWAYDSYHGSNYGYYLEALLDFGKITGLDPRSLDGKTRVPEALGISPAQSKALMQVAYDTLQAAK